MAKAPALALAAGCTAPAARPPSQAAAAGLPTPVPTAFFSHSPSPPLGERAG